MKRTFQHLFTLAAAAALAGCSGGGSSGGGGGGPALKTEDDKTLYALGLSMGRNLAPFKLSANDLAIVEEGVYDQTQGKKAQVPLETYGPKIRELARARQTAAAEAEKEKSKPFLEQAAKEPGAVKTPSGLVFRTLKEGNGPSPTATDRVKVHYHGTLTDGTVFDSSVQRGTPAEFPLNGVIPCWTEGVQRMKVGEKAKLVCPSTIAYGDQGRPPTIPGGATLVFEIELLDILKGPPTPMGMPGMPPGGMPGAFGGMHGGAMMNRPGGPQMQMPPGHPATLQSGAGGAGSTATSPSTPAGAPATPTTKPKQ